MPSEITPRELAARLTRGEPTVLVDVREPWEHAHVALPGSVLVPLRDLPTRYATLAPSPAALIVTYCHHGVRSLDAASFLVARGWQGVVSLAGGIDAWSRDVDVTMPRY